MKPFSKIILLFLFAQLPLLIFANENKDIKPVNKSSVVNKTSIIKAPTDISAKIEGNASVCQNATKPVIKFTGSGGTAPYTFIYQINGGSEQTISSATASDNATVDVSTNTAGSYVYKLIKVFDAKDTLVLNVAATINVNALPTISGSLKACLGGGNIQLSGSASPDATLPWQSSNTAVATISPTGLVTPVSVGSTNISYKNTNGCVVTAELVVNALPVVDFTFADNQCSGTGVQFTPTVTGNYSYLWDFGDGKTSKEETPTHTFNAFGSGTKNYDVKLTITDKTTTCQNSKLKSIGIKQIPDAALDTIGTDGATLYDLNQHIFLNCNATYSSPKFDFVAVNASSTKSINTSYLIDWGDGGLSETLPSTFISKIHTYSSLGYFTIKITSFNSISGCSNTKFYTFFSGNTPGGNLTNIPNTQDCVPYTITWPVENTKDNTPGTTYIFSVDDGTTNSTQYFNQTNLPSSISYTFNKSSCYKPDKKFTVTFNIANPCNSSAPTLQVQATQKPIAKFDISPDSIICLNSTATFKNTTNGTYLPGNSCYTNYNKTWSITPNSGWIGSLSNSESIPIKFTATGDYSIKLKIRVNGSATASRCTEDSITRIIRVNPLPTATISGGATVCQNSTPAPLITFTGANGTAPYTFTYKINNGVNKTVKTTTGNSVTVIAPTSASGTFTYSLVSVQEGSTASCSQLQTGTAIITVNPLPTATISGTKGVCLGDASPLITFTGANGTAPYTFTYNINGGVAQSITTSAGNSITVSAPTSTAGIFKYNLVSVQDASTTSCSQSQVGFATITINPIPTVTDIVSQTKCNGEMSDVITFSGSVVGTVFNWTNNNTSIGLSATGSGDIKSFKLLNTSAIVQKADITVTPTFSSAGVTCTGIPKTFSIIVNPAPTITKQPISSAVCKGGTATPLWVEYKNGIGKGTFQWYSNTVNSNTGAIKTGGVDSTFIPPTSQVNTMYYYCVITLPMGGCSVLTSSIAKVEVNEIPIIISQPTPTQSMCLGGSISTPLSVNYSGGTGNVTCQWYLNNTKTITGATAITGANGLNYTPPAFITLGDYYYFAEIKFSGIGCTSITSDFAEIKVVADPQVTLQPLASQTLCQGSAPTKLSVIADGGLGVFSYQWYSNTINSNTGGSILVGFKDSTFIPSTLTVGTNYYYCVVSQPKGAGCTVSSSVATVNVNPAPAFTTQPISSAVCLNGIPTTLSVTYTNGVGSPKYQWFQNVVNNNTAGDPILGETNPTYKPPTNVVDTVFYYCVISLSSGGCTQITSNVASVAVTAIPVITAQPTPTQSLCIGGTIPTPLTLSYSGGTGVASCQWYSNTTNSNVGGTKILTGTDFKFTPAAFSIVGSNYYYAEITFTGSACTSLLSEVAEIKVVPDPIITSQPLSSQTLCQGATPTVLTVTANGGLGEFSYQWYSRLPFESGLGTLIIGATKDTFTPPTLTVGTTNYYCILAQPNGAGCNATSNMATVIVNTAPFISEQPASSTVCLGSVPTLLRVKYKNRIGLPSYQWYSNTVKSTSGSLLIPTATDSIYSPPALVASTMYYYCIINLPAGGCGNLISEIATVIINPNPVIASVKTLISSAESFTITPTNLGGDIVPLGTKFTWKTPTVSPLNSITGATAQSIPQSSISQLLTNNTTTQATVKYIVTPISGVCVGADFEVIVTVNPPLNPNVKVNDISCFGFTDGGFTTNIQGGIPPYVISWSGPNGFTSDKTAISGLEKGDYTLKITDKSSVAFEMSLKISEPYEIVIFTEKLKNVSCNGANNGEIGINATGGTGDFTYSWTKDNVAFSKSKDLLNLSPGTYEVTVSDINKCGPKTATFTITEPPVLTVNLISQTDLMCFGDSVGTINVSAGGGTKKEISKGIYDYIYSWKGPNGFSSPIQNLTGLKAGEYTLTVTDSLNCTQSLTVKIKQPDDIKIDAVIKPVSCYGANDASITVSISGGIPGYKIEWDNLAKGLYLPDLAPGNYSITITDANECKKTRVITIDEARFAMHPTTKNISCYGAKDGSISLNIVGGTPPIKLIWDDNATAGNVRNRLSPGTYTATLSDASACTFSKTFIIVAPLEMKLSATITNAFDCVDTNSGAIDLKIDGGTKPYNISWSNSATTEDLTAISAGKYAVRIVDANGCELVAQYEVMRRLPINLSVKVVSDFNCLTKTLKRICTAQIVGGIPPYKYNWSSGTVSGVNYEIMETSQSGIVILDVIDGNGCTANYSFDLLVPTPGIDYQLLDCDTHSYRFESVIPSGEVIDYTYQWDFGDGKTEALQNPEHTYAAPGTYKVTLTMKGKNCTSEYEKYVKVEAPPVLVLDKLPIYCAGDSLLLHVSGAETYRWYNGVVGDSLLIKQTGDYSVTGTSKAGCTSTLNFTATNFKPYNFTLQTDKNEITTENPDLQLWSEGNVYSDYFWNFGDSITAEGNNQHHVYKIQKGGYYDVKLRVKNPNGCNEYATKRIWITDNSTNNTFTPNGDGVDDVFLQGWHAQIYNRNGILLYDGVDGWNGTYKGSPVANDTYFYIEFISTLDGIKTKTGFVTVVR